ncbi:YesN/AraC family two-component response regulator [Paenibacillus endophyticus]|uniref:YesN/AraC family two-component response regulator n=1 Tax=Paenibacillus endophyticus TaxID=1294268 RepID=A0A7W5G9S4_9BACL|nr:response regulator [Paenibacillus endophyticus]MBB3152484.1 YesN/AraC family two-component response regulator [Paenibacillus endophyticus]
MFKLIIVDDNKYERMGIKQAVDWGALEIEVVGTFANGAEALAGVGELHPDLIVTDIAMPMMNGIALAERVRDQYPDIKMIFTSCHSDFEFAKSAVNLGVYGYVLKPIISGELESAVRSVLGEMTERERRERERAGMLRQLEGMLPLVQEQFFKELLLGNFRDERDISERIGFLHVSVPDNSSFAVLALDVREKEEPTSGEPSRSVVDTYYQSYTIKKAVNALERGAALGAVSGESDGAPRPDSDSKRQGLVFAYPVQIAGDSFAVLLFGESEQFLQTTVNLHLMITERLDRSVTIGISEASSSLSAMAELYRQARQAALTTFYEGSSPIIVYSEIVDRAERSPFDAMPGLESLYGDVKVLLSYGGEEVIDEFLDKYMSLPGGGVPHESYVKVFSYLTLNLVNVLLEEANKSLKELLGEESADWSYFNVPAPAPAKEARVWLRRIFATLREALAERNPTKNQKVIDQIRDIIGQRYGEALTIEDISKSVYLSGRHANHIFKKETGQTIFDYLIDYRIGIAKGLLKEQDSKVAVVAEAVGYVNTSYFCLAFKKNVGMTPAEYKNKSMLR